MLKKLFASSLLILPLLAAPQSLSGAAAVMSNDLVYGGGTTQVTSEISEYQTLAANKPIQGSIFVTHESKNKIDEGSFKLGDQPLKVTLAANTQISLSSTIYVTVYNFQIEGLPPGTHTLPSISVKVGDKRVEAQPLIIQVF